MMLVPVFAPAIGMMVKILFWNSVIALGHHVSGWHVLKIVGKIACGAVVVLHNLLPAQHC